VKNQENQKKSENFKRFSDFCGFGNASIRKSAKKLQNEILDVKKLDDTAENEPSQASKIRKI
jgi:hypothetical protein